ncbi:MAG: nitrogenase component 1 [Candidatus Fimivivens sp.]
MYKLSVKLPPFSPDYSGVCSALFDLKCLAVLHDASGCSGNYTGYDEPRWYGSRATIYCSGLREIDAILGDDEKMIQKILQAADSLHPDLIALIGTPVPMVIGTDMKGIATDIEQRTGIPCLGFDTTGTQYYSDGIAQVCTALAARFTQPQAPKNPRGVNLLGLNRLDFDPHSTNALKRLLADHGFEIIASFCDGLTLPDIKNAAQASLNIVVSQSGISPARYFEQQHGIPYVVGIPVGEQMTSDWLAELLSSIETQKSCYLDTDGHDADTLILGDAVLCKSLQRGLLRSYGIKADCGCIFGTEVGYQDDGLLDLANEQKISMAINSGKYRTVIGDPMFRVLLKADTNLHFIDYPIYCVSSKMAKQVPLDLIGSEFDACFSGLLQIPSSC